MKHNRNLSGGCQIALKGAPIDGRRALRPTASVEELATAGWVIVPVEAGGKRPLVAWTRYKERGVSPEQIGEWREQFPNCNWAVLLGPPSGNLIAIDIDGPEGQAWCDEQGGFTHFPTAWHNTGRGWHYFYRVPDELATLGVVKPHPQVEFRISDCLCLIPPSIHENGERYEWRIPPNPGGKTLRQSVNRTQLTKAVWPIPMAPEWVLRALRSEAGQSLPEPPPAHPHSSPQPLVALLAQDLRLADYIMRHVGRNPVPPGKLFLCILPGHEERHPSASWWVAQDGRVLYRDWHMRDGREWYGLAEVWRAVTTGEHPRHLDPCTAVQTLVSLAHRAKRLVPLTRELIAEGRTALNRLLEETTESRINGNESSIDDSVVSQRHPKPTPSTILKVWRVMEQLFLSRARTGRASALASARYVANLAGVSPPMANRACNLFCVLGLMRKVGNRKKGDVFELCQVDFGEVRRRWELLGRPSLSGFNRDLVVARLGEEAASRVFRRTETGDWWFQGAGKAHCGCTAGGETT